MPTEAALEKPSFARSVTMYSEARRTLAAGVSSNVRLGGAPSPLYYVRGKGAHLFDVDGNRSIDYVLGNGPAILGHAPDAVLDAVRDSLDDGQLFGAQNTREVALSQALCRVLPNAELIRFATSGTEAVQMAFRLARSFTGRNRIIKFEGHYHGWVDSVAFSVKPSENAAGPATHPVPVPETPGIARDAAEGLIVCGWNDLDALDGLLRAHGHDVAAVIMEPMMVNGGVIPPEPGYLPGVQSLCRQHGAVFICDEVITGFRVGLTGGQGRAGVQPDLSIYAKAISGGFPLSAVAGRRDIMEQLGSGVSHGGTYNGHVQSMAAGLAVIEQLTRDDGAAYRAMDLAGGRLMAGLRDLARRHQLPLQVNGLPTVFQTAVSAADVPKTYRDAARFDQQLMTAFVDAMRDAGIRINPRGVWFLSTAHDEAVIDDTLGRAARAMGEFSRTYADIGG